MEGPPKPSSIASWSVTLRPFGYFGSIGYVNSLPLGNFWSVMLFSYLANSTMSGLAIRNNSALKQKIHLEGGLVAFDYPLGVSSS